MIDSQQFNQQLLTEPTLTFAKTYLFYGQTLFLSEENAHNLIAVAKQNGFTQREVFYIDNRTKFQGLINSIQSPSLFDSKKIIEIRFDTDKPTKKIGEQVAKIASHQSENLLIIQASALLYKSQKEKWFSEIVKTSTAVLSKPIYANQLPNWIHQRANYLNLQLSSDALKTIINFSEGNLLWTNQILMQLSQSDHPQPIHGKAVDEMLADMSVFQIEDLSRALLNKKLATLKIIQKLQQENQPLVLITTVLYRELDTLSQIIFSGLPFSQVCKQLKIRQNKQRDYQTAINHYDVEKLTNALKELALLDKINKGQHGGDGWLLLTKIVSNLVI